MNIKERIENELQRNKNSTTTNINFRHKQIYEILKKLKLDDTIDTYTLSKKITEYIMRKK